jgi:uncharacterized protein (DUF58 family)
VKARTELSVSRLSALLLLVFFSAVLGFANGNRILIALSETFLALTGLLYLYARLAASGIAVSRSFPPRTYEEQVVRVTLRLRNRFGLPLYLVGLRDRFTPDGLPEKKLLAQRVPARGAAQVEYAGACVRGRGRFPVGPLEVAVSDPLGLFQVKRVFSELQEIGVYPRTFPIHDLGIEVLERQAPVRVFAGRAGQASTFFGTREYRPGEDIRRIHWPATARWGRLVIKEFEQDANLEVTVFLDLDRRTLRGLGRGSNVEQAVRIAASVAEHVASRLYSFQLLADPETPLILRARPGKAQLIAALEALSAVRATGRTSYLDLIAAGLRFVSPGGAVVLIFNTLDIDAEGLFWVLSEAKRRSTRVVAIAFDDATFLALESAGPAPAASGERLIRLRETLGAFGVTPLVVGSRDDLASLFTDREARAEVGGGPASCANRESVPP